jgi:hypothetical protein
VTIWSEATVQTDDLVALLSNNVAPMPKGLVLRRLGVGAFAGCAATAIIMIFTLKLRPDLTSALAGPAFWMKFSYTAALAGLGLWILERQARAAADSRLPTILLAVPVLALLAAAIWQASRPQADIHDLTMGHTAKVCSSLILLLAVPIFAAVFSAVRTLAPTRLTLAGAAAGVLAGASSAAIYCFHCPETAAPFVLIWYSLGILLATGLGALFGRWVLRW